MVGFLRSGRSGSFILLSVLMLCSAVAMAAAPSKLPFPRVEVGYHTDRPTGIAVDQQRGWLITAADDRSIRVWDRDSGRLLNKAYVPMSTRKEGELYALDIAPKHNMLAVAGWTGYEWDRNISVYILDIDSLKILGRVRPLNERVTALAFSRDQSRLAVSLLNGETLIFGVPGFRQIASNTNCRAMSYKLNFSVDGRLVSNCFDGVIRVYDSNLALLAEKEIWQDHQPGAVVFSPDGKKILVSYYDKPRAVILNSSDLSTLKEITLDLPDDQPVPEAIWADDGRSIYFAGDANKNGSYQLLKWSEKSGSSAAVAELSRKRVFRLHSLGEKGIAYTTLEQAVGRVDSRNKIAYYNKPAMVSHLDHAGFLKISLDATEVSFALDDWGKESLTFSLVDRKIAKSGGTKKMLSPRTQAAGFSITNWDGSNTPEFNGRTLKLAPGQQGHALAISPKNDYFILGLDSEMRRYNKDGRLAWSVYPNAGVQMVNISADGSVIVTGHQDGTIRWFRAEDGVEFFALFPHANKKDWVAWTPPGFFISSPDGDQYIGWQLNNGPGDAADFYSAWQFERLLYRPDIVQDYFASRGRWQNSDASTKFKVDNIREVAPPDIHLKSVSSSSTKSLMPESVVDITVKKRALPIREYAVYVNDIPVTRYDKRRIAGREKDGFNRQVKVALDKQENVVRVEALTDKSLGVKELYLDASGNEVRSREKGDLYILAIGVNELVKLSADESLRYAAQDAVSFEKYFKQGGAFRRVHRKVLSDFSAEKPTKKNILAALDFLKDSGPDDMVVVFIASHGISNPAGDYFMLPRDASREDVNRVLKGKDAQSNPDSLVRWDAFFNGIRSASGKRLLIVDTCQAQKIKGNFDFGSLAKRSSAASFALLAASAGNEESQEYNPAQHGLFTFALLNGLAGKADLNGDKSVELEELHQFVSEYVNKNRLLRNKPQTPQMIAPEGLQRMVLSKDI